MTKQVFVSLFISLLVICSLPQRVRAEVRLPRGEFIITYVDIAYAGGVEPKIERTYYSKSSYRGIFGRGWGSTYESHLMVTGYGPIILQEDAAGDAVRFIPEDWTAAKAREVVDLIVEAATKNKELKASADADNLKSKLLKDPGLVDQQWRKYSDKGLLPFRQLSLGSKVRGERFGYEDITRVAEGYVYYDGYGHKQTFNEAGRLVGLSDANGNSIQLVLDSSGNCASLKDNFGRKMTFIYNSRRLVEKIIATGGASADRIATYKYDDQDEMVYSRDWMGNEYQHEYTTPSRMSKIRYADKTTRDMTYYGEEGEWNVKSIKDPDGTLSLYSYIIDDTDGTLFIDENIRDAKSVVSKNKYVYFYKNKSVGERWNWRKLSTTDGGTIDTYYDENCGCPTSIKTNNVLVTFVYDVKGRVTKKVAPSETTEFSYDNLTGRVSLVKRYSPAPPSKLFTAQYTYDSKGNMIRGETSDRKWVELVHDEYGRIKEMKDSDSRHITFEYNGNSKPTRIQVLNVGSINVEYESDGETVKKVNSPPARNAVTQVTAAFNLLTNITKLGKVNFSL